MTNICIKTLENLMVSKVRVKVLKYFIMNPDAPLHLRGAVREFKEEINSVRRELARLEESNFITSEQKGNKKYFALNKEHYFYDELVGIIFKTYSLGGEILENKKKLGKIDFAFLTPYFTKGIHWSTQPVDLVMIGDIDMSVMEEIIHDIQNEMGREIHYMILKPLDFQTRKRRRDQFILDLMSQNNIMLIGRYEDFVK